jgi:choline dehydrogenase-like flavoprotein
MTPTGSNATNRFDYIVVGSGAGGGPLAARLARDGFNVLVIEAGSDHSAEGGDGHEVSLVPGLHAVSTEHKALSWKFWVKHYNDPPAGKDPKCHPKDGKEPPPEGIFYPRASGLGGCTVHNAMITVAGPDADWEDLADFVGDDSWRGAPMRHYFQKLERNQYLKPPRPIPTRWWGRLWDILKWVFGYTPDHTRGRHGFSGWLHTSLTDASLGLGDRQLLRMLKGALWQSLHARLDRAWTTARRFLKGRGSDALDPNHARTQAESPEGLVMIPLAVCGEATTIHQNSAMPFVQRGRRSSPREFLLETKQRHPDRLTIWTDVLVTRVLFAPGDGGRPRAIGVSYLKGRDLYEAHDRYDAGDSGAADTVFVKSSGEVILCGGAFNTPQLLMLSGIGNAGELQALARAEGHEDACTLSARDGKPLLDGQGRTLRIDLPGVGRNLQDRYEVTVVSKVKRPFSILDGASFALPGPGGPDRHLKEWRQEGTGLYTSNGAVLGILKRSNLDLEQPDLFIFGLPLSFRGYDLDYSKVEARDLFTWAILKGNTRNSDGVVKLRSLDPRHRPDINFHYFNETVVPGGSEKDPDLEALVDGVKFVRGIAKRANGWFHRPVVGEDYPGYEQVPPDDDDCLRAWIRRDAWGHHACGTCRMGPKDDPNAVLDSRFRVRGVAGLRVVDASIFPRIPGYFIVANIYMASEKAADVIADDARRGGADSSTYPLDLHRAEAEAIKARRAAVGASTLPVPTAAGEPWPENVAGLALSGGGVRSATFNLGVLQALARRQWLRRFDFLSTVSGGGYIGTFLGRWFDRLRPQSDFGGSDRHPDQRPVDVIERELNDPASPAVAWLRRQGNYIAPQGAGDRQVNSAIFVRNFLSVHFVVGLLLFTIFGIANAVRYGLLETATGALEFAGITPSELPLGRLLVGLLGIFYSVWFIVFEAVVLFMVVPRMAAYWIVSPKRHERYEAIALLALFVTSGALLFAAVRGGLDVPLLLLGLAPLVSIIHVEMAWHRGHEREEAIGRGNVETQRMRTRNYLTYDLGLALALAGGAFAFAVIDTAGHALQQYIAGSAQYIGAITSLIASVAALAPIVRFLANLFAGDKRGAASALPHPSREQIIAGVLSILMAALPLVLVSFLTHAAYRSGAALVEGLAATALALVLSWIFAHKSALSFVNRSSLSQVYAARLARAYLGATNPVRYRPQAASVTEVVAGDDVESIRDYRPYAVGGPLHLINMTVNQTVEFTSLRGNRDRKGEIVTVSPIGLTVGKRWHTAWGEPPQRRGSSDSKQPSPLVPLGHVNGTDHPLVDETGAPTSRAEMLPLRQWMAISGAAVGPGRGQTTKLGTALLFGLANLRTGHWWDSGLPQFARDGLPPLTLLRRVSYLLRFFFHTQALLLSEWVARFPGPWDRFWYLSDGGFFEVLGAYELIRRRVPRIIVCDASADPAYEMESFANLTRKARIDFNADIRPFTAQDYDDAGIPDAVRKLLGTLDELKPLRDGDGKAVGPSPKHAALFWVRYHTGSPRRPSVLLYVKANLTGDESVDVLHYHKTHPEFPHEPTSDQFFDELQWESYRRLGEHLVQPLCADANWFWNIPLPQAES